MLEWCVQLFQFSLLVTTYNLTHSHHRGQTIRLREESLIWTWEGSCVGGKWKVLRQLTRACILPEVGLFATAIILFTFKIPELR